MQAITSSCFHCGNACGSDIIVSNDQAFCCEGCRLVFSILHQNGLQNYYAINKSPGVKADIPESGLFDYLDDEEIKSQLLHFEEGETAKITFYIPAIHCSSCLWLLEHSYRLNPAIKYAQVNFLKKQATITYNPQHTSLKEVVMLITSIGYQPLISLSDVVKQSGETQENRNLLLKIAVAGFCFGNMMLFSFPEYLGIDLHSRVDLAPVFNGLNILLALPVFFYSAGGYFSSAFRLLRRGILHLDVPLALGILVLFVHSLYEIISQTGAGYMDTLGGLVFFLLIGKWMQTRTFAMLSFERDYTSFFPVAVTLLQGGIRKSIPVAKLKKGDRIYIRNNELVPADALLIKGNAAIDYSFITGESFPVFKPAGSIVRAGGRQVGQAIELEVQKEVSQAYLTQLWNQEAFRKGEDQSMETFSNKVSRYFTIVLLAIALISFLVWLPADLHKAITVFATILIIACPCALALSSPFTLGNALRILGKQRLYLKNTGVIEQLAHCTDMVFDKTGTLTRADQSAVKAHFGIPLAAGEIASIISLSGQSTHPLSRMIESIGTASEAEITDYMEEPGKGISARVNGLSIRLGSASFLELPYVNDIAASNVYVEINGQYRGFFEAENVYRKGLKEVLRNLGRRFALYMLSGDQPSEKARLEEQFPADSALYFKQTPVDKLNFIKSLQGQGKKVIMVGDGLNDAGALKQSNVGIAVTEDITVFSPSCDAILDASVFEKLPAFMRYVKSCLQIIHISFAISLLYNLVGLGFAVQGLMSPLLAAILMPLSSVTVIVFTTLASGWAAKKGGVL